MAKVQRDQTAETEAPLQLFRNLEPRIDAIVWTDGNGAYRSA
jgi:hypothetical protein